VATEEAVLLVIEVLQLLAAMSEQTEQPSRYDSLVLHNCGALLLRRQLEVLQRCPFLQERHSSVVQQSVQQLMQLLRWQLQQAAQRSTLPCGAGVASVWEEVMDGISDSAKQMLVFDLIGSYSGVCFLRGL
jgi:hypothetical protein